MNKTQWLDWVEASADRLQERYRQAWNRAPRGQRGMKPGEEPKRWTAILPEIDRETRAVVVHLELPEPHTVEAEVRVINSTLSIAVLRTGSDIERAPAENCYRRAIPLPPRVDPKSATHKIHGDELVIRLRPRAARRRTAKSGATANVEKTATEPVMSAPRRAKAASGRVRRVAAPSSGEGKRSRTVASR